MSETTPATGDTDARPLLTDEGWDEDAVGEAFFDAEGSVMGGSSRSWHEHSDELRQTFIDIGVTFAEAVRQDLIRRLAAQLNGGDRPG